MSTTANPNPPPTVFVPPKPKHGGLVQTGTDTKVPYTGGKPKVGFGDIDPTVKFTQTVLPTMQRPLSSSAAKIQYYRMTCLHEEKFNPNGNRIKFERMIMKHFERYGLDTITYLQGPDGTMMSIITDHAKFTMEEAEKAEKEQFTKHYDLYDKSNVLDAIEYVTSALDDHLEEQVHQVQIAGEGFIVFWMKLMSIIKSTSIDYYESIKAKIRGLRISNEPGQDVTLLCSKYYQYWKLLDQGGVYDNYLTVHMVKELTKTGTESYRFELISIKKKLDEKLRQLNNMSYADSQKELAKDKLDVLNVLEQIKQEYRRLYDDGEWPAAMTRKDKSGLPATFGQVNAATLESNLKQLEANVLQRVQQGLKSNNPGSKKKGNCYICDSPDHWADKCPNKNKKEGRRDKNKSDHRSKKTHKPRSGKFPPPKDGESEVRSDDKGVKHYWCAKCRSWKTTHSTATHKPKRELQPQAHVGVAKEDLSTLDIEELAGVPFAFAVTRMNTEPTTRLPCTISTAKNLLILTAITTCALGLHPYVPILVIILLITMNKYHGHLHHWFSPPFTISQPSAETHFQAYTPIRSYPGPGANGPRVIRVQRPGPPSSAPRGRWTPPTPAYLRRKRRRRTTPPRTSTETPPQEERADNDSAPTWSRTHINPEDSDTTSYCCTTANDSMSTHRVLFDSGANVCITNNIDHFIDKPTASSTSNQLIGIGKALRIEAYGKVSWTFESSTGKPVTLTLPCCYVPTSNFCIMSTSTLVKYYPQSVLQITTRGMTLQLTQPQATILIATDTASKLPFAHLTSKDSATAMASSSSSQVPSASLIERNNFNLSDVHKELLKWHYKLGHKGFRTIQWMFRNMYLAFTTKDRHVHHRASKLSDTPLCTACQYAKQRRRTTPGTRKVVVPQEKDMTHRDIVFPGQRVAADHLKSSLRGRLPHTYGKEAEDDRYSGSCLFMDYASSYIYVYHQVQLNSNETLLAKKQFESVLARYGVTVQSYITDNGTAFKNKEYTAHLEQFHQHTTYAAVGAHHSNSKAERGIGTISSIARALLHHSAIHWPDVADPALWPLAVDHAVRLHNCIPRSDTGLSPVEVLTKTTFPRQRFADFHVWGCPAYILDGKLADGKKIPKWSPRSERYMYLGLSPNHSGAVPLILNLSSGKIVPHFHVVCDNWFSTVSSTSKTPVNFDHDHWYRTFGTNTSQYIVPDSSHEPEIPSSTPHERTIQENIANNQTRQTPPLFSPVHPLDTHDPLDSSASFVPPPAPPSPNERESTSPERESTPLARQTPQVAQPTPSKQVSFPVIPPNHSSPRIRSPPPQRDTTSIQEAPPPSVPPSSLQRENSPADSTPPVLRRSKRQLRRPPPRFDPSSSALSFEPSSYAARTIQADPQLLTRPGLYWNGPSKSAMDKDIQDPLINFWSRMMTGFEPNLSNDNHTYSLGTMLDEVYAMHRPNPFIHIVSEEQKLSESLVAAAANASVTGSNHKSKKSKKSKSDPLTFSLYEAMKSPHWEDLRAAFDIEIKALEAHDTWDEVPMEEAERRGKPIVPSTLVGRIKVNPLGEYIKSKGRCCLRGDLQDQTEDNYSPVASWSSIRTILLLSQLHGRVTCTIDFSNAFVQSPLPDDEVIYMGIPPGYASSLGPRTCLRLKKSIYGSRTAPLRWLTFIQSKLKLLGMKQSDNDPCVWFGNGLIIAQYVDDFGISAETSEDIDKFVASLQELGLELTRESSFSEFLGIKFTTHEDGSIEMTQPGLIKKILEATKMTDAKPNRLPYPATLLSKDKKGEPYQEEWNYLSILGMCLYLSTNSRPDLILAVSQLARFSSDPKQSHAKAMKHLLRYLRGTSDKGTLVKPSKEIQLEMYVDADYAGLFGIEDPEDKDSARSRMGYLARLGNFPIVAKSMLHTSVVQSTAESEYTALSYALKVLIPLQQLVQELMTIIGKGNLPKESIKMKATVFEDNQAAFHLATNQRVTSRSRYFHTKLHWFFHELNKEDSVFTIEYCPTDKMLADWYTKPTKPEGFERTRETIMGW